MKGRSVFSADEISRIRSLLGRKLHVSRSEQKRLRDELRSLGFYITDHRPTGRPYGPAELDAAVMSGQISVRG